MLTNLAMFRSCGRTVASYLSHNLTRTLTSRLGSLEEAKAAIELLKSEPNNDSRLQLYGLFQQATIGACTDAAPKSSNFVTTAKWQAWNSFRSLSKKEAVDKYIQLVSELVDKETDVGTILQTPCFTSGPTDIEISTSEDGVICMHLNRPNERNLITFEMYRIWLETLNRAARDPKVKLLAITGKGDYYTAGNDFVNLKTRSVDLNRNSFLKIPGGILYELFAALIDFPKPLIALVNGPAVCFGVAVLGLFDYILAVDEATFRTPFTSLGLSPECCSSYIFPRMMGTQMANDVLLFGRRLTAEEACACGLVTRVVARSRFSSESDELLKRISQLPPKSMMASKRIIRAHERDTLHEVNRQECKQLFELVTSDEHLQAVTSLLRR